jgi:hypothetical protein
MFSTVIPEMAQNFFYMGSGKAYAKIGEANKQLTKLKFEF